MKGVLEESLQKIEEETKKIKQYIEGIEKVKTDMRKVAYEEGYNHGYVKGIMTVIECNTNEHKTSEKLKLIDILNYIANNQLKEHTRLRIYEGVNTDYSQSCRYLCFDGEYLRIDNEHDGLKYHTITTEDNVIMAVAKDLYKINERMLNYPVVILPIGKIKHENLINQLKKGG